MADTGGLLVVTGDPATDKGGPMVVTGGHLDDTAGPLTEIGGPLAATGGPFANKKGSWVSGGPLSDIRGFPLECYLKRILCLDGVMLAVPIIGDERAQFYLCEVSMSYRPDGVHRLRVTRAGNWG